MSSASGVQGAMQFAGIARSDPALRARLERLEPGTGLRPVLRIASELGYRFTEDDLRQAHRHDWALRRVHYVGVDRPVDRAASTVAVVNAPLSST